MEPKKWIKPSRRGRMGGMEIQIDKRTMEEALKGGSIPLDTPVDQLRVTRYMTRQNIIILKVKHISTLTPEELEGRV